MKTFEEILASLRSDIQGMASSENVDQIANMAKSLDTLEELHNDSKKEAAEAKENLVNYVKTYAFKKPAQNETGIETPVSIEDAFENATKEILEKRGKKE